MSIQQIRFEIDCPECLAWQNQPELYVRVSGKPVFVLRSFARIRNPLMQPSVIVERIIRALPGDVLRDACVQHCEQCDLYRFEIVCYEAE